MACGSRRLRGPASLARPFAPAIQRPSSRAGAKSRNFPNPVWTDRLIGFALPQSNILMTTVNFYHDLPVLESFVEAIETDLRIPAIGHLTSEIWLALKALNIQNPIRGFGKLLTMV